MRVRRIYHYARKVRRRMKAEKKQKNKDKNSSKKSHVSNTVKSVLEIAYYDDDTSCFVMDDGNFMDLIQINTKDLVSSADDEVEYDIMKFTKLYKMYADDLKITVMNFPCKTSVQQEYITHKIKTTSNEIYKKFLQRQLDELVWIEKNDMMREYYFMIFGKKKAKLISNRNLIFNVLGSGRKNLSQKISKDKKILICERLNNKCFLVG